MTIALVTDSAASLPAELIQQYDIAVIPLQVMIEDQAQAEYVPIYAPAGVTGAQVAQALEAKKRVTTSRPSPAEIAQLYQQLVEQGATEIISVHLSAKLSATIEGARIAAAEVRVPVHVVDSGHVSIGLGLAVVTAAQALDGDATATEAIAALRRQAQATTSLFYVDSLEFLRRGGRITAAAAWLGSALSVKPILTIADGEVQRLEKVRTSARALERLAELALGAYGGGAVQVAVAHLAAADRAAQLAATLADRLHELNPEAMLEPVLITEVGAALGAHVGPGTVAAVLTPRL